MELVVFRSLFALLCVALVLPLWVCPYPPLVDLPQHAGQLSSALGWLEDAPRHRETFELNPFTPYLGGYLLAGPWVALFVPSVGLRLALSVALVALPLATVHLLRTARNPRLWALTVFAVAPGYAFHWGFLGFIVAAPLGLWGLSYHLRFLESGKRSDRGASAALAFLCFVAHALVFVWLAVSAGLASLPRRRTQDV